MSALSASSTSSVSEPSSSTSRSSTLRADSLGVVGMTTTVVSAAAPLTVMAGVAPVALAVGGVGVPAAYLLAGLVLAIFAIGFTAMAAAIPRTGGFFIYIGHSFGGVMGFASAVVAIVSYNCLQIGVYGLFAIQTQAALDDLFGVSAPWPLIAAIAVVLVYALGYVGIDIGAKVLGVLIILESGDPRPHGRRDHRAGRSRRSRALRRSPPRTRSTPGRWRSSGICFAAYMGFESTALYRAEARDPERTIPRATFLAVGFMALFYCVRRVVGRAGFRRGRIPRSRGRAGTSVVLHHDRRVRRRLGRARHVRPDRHQRLRRTAGLPQRDQPVRPRDGCRRRAAPRCSRAPTSPAARQSRVACRASSRWSSCSASLRPSLDPFTQLLIGVNTPASSASSGCRSSPRSLPRCSSCAAGPAPEAIPHRIFGRSPRR